MEIEERLKAIEERLDNLENPTYCDETGRQINSVEYARQKKKELRQKLINIIDAIL